MIHSRRQILAATLAAGSLAKWGPAMAQSDLQRLDPNAGPKVLESKVAEAFLGATVEDVPSRVADLGGRRDSYSMDNAVVGPKELSAELWRKAAETGLILRFGLPRRIFKPDLRIMVTLRSKDGIVTSVNGFRTFAK